MFRRIFNKSTMARLLGFALILALLAPAALADAAEEIAMHLYTDDTDGTTFMLPDGWIEEPGSMMGVNSITAYTAYPGLSRRLIFLHASVDSWASETSQMMSRTSYDQMMNQKATISSAFGNAEIEEVEFNGVTYFCYNSQESTWQYFRYHNGILHMFQYDVDTSDPNYAYFEAIMNSVEFPEIP